MTKPETKRASSKLMVPLFAAVLLAGAGAGIAGIASAQSAGTPAQDAGDMGMHGKGRGVMGTVVSVSGSTITLQGKDGTTYTIDAGSATISKVETITASSITPGDTLMVGGTVNGSTVTADHIMDGTMPTGMFGPHGHRKGPSIVGSVSAINGTTLTVAGKNGTTYSVDASQVHVKKFVEGGKPKDATLSDVVLGDTVGIRGTVNGQNVTATEIFDGIPPQRGPNE